MKLIFPDTEFEILISEEEENIQFLARTAYYDSNERIPYPKNRKQPPPRDVIWIIDKIEHFTNKKESK
ncbi:hypothetical protein KBC54_03345 [Patescibacteria group bacterium]|nr:hypothetical protein [Patescibacteria group bacterium]